jgi:hypothetical protein
MYVACHIPGLVWGLYTQHLTQSSQESQERNLSTQLQSQTCFLVSALHCLPNYIKWRVCWTRWALLRLICAH